MKPALVLVLLLAPQDKPATAPILLRAPVGAYAPTGGATADESQDKKPHPRLELHSAFKIPRPHDGARDVPPATSVYFEILGGTIDTKAVTVGLSDGKTRTVILEKGAFATGFAGRILPSIRTLHETGAGFWFKPAVPLKPATRYTVDIAGPATHSWSFTTAPADFSKDLEWSLDLAALKPVSWQGQIWAGMCRPTFTTTELYDQTDAHAQMRAVREKSASPVWSLFRPWPLAGDFHMNIFNGNPNLVRERETRRVAKIDEVDAGTRLTLEDTFEHKLYGIEDNRRLSADYHAGDDVLIADAEKSERATVVAVDDATRTVIVKKLKQAAWKLEATHPTPPEDPAAPGRFTHPMCYLRKFAPSGTPVYYWARLDKELDRLVKTDGFRLVLNFNETPCDLSIDGVPNPGGTNGSPNRPKDYVEYFDYVRTVTRHVAARYGKAAQDFVYSVGNEFDLKGFFWRGTEDEALEFYDVTVDAMLRGLEDEGIDTTKVHVGGMEWATLWGNLDMLKRFAAHCSPKTGTNAAWKIEGLKGRHSARVSERGSPCSFASIHTYASAEEAARRMIEAKRLLLEADADYFRDAFIRVHECAPEWIPFDDPAQRTAFRASGFYPAWCADVYQRLVAKAAVDPRYARVEGVLTIWPQEMNGTGNNNMVTLFRKKGGGFETVPLPVFHVHTLLGKMSREVVALEARDVHGVRVAGIASKHDDGWRILLYALAADDTESAGRYEFRVKLKIGTEADVTEWRLDRDHGSLAKVEGLPGFGAHTATFDEAQIAEIRKATALGSREWKAAGVVETGVAENGVTLVEVKQGRK